MSTNRRNSTLFAVAILAALAATPGAAQYDYGYGGGSSAAGGWIVSIEGVFTNPRNADNVVAVIDSTPRTPVIPVWDDEIAGRLGFGYRWDGGSAVTVSLWSFDTEQPASGAGSFEFPIGPAALGLGSFSGAGDSFDLLTEMTAQTLDVAWSRMHSPVERLTLEWSLGLRSAEFEETTAGIYRDGTDVFAVDKSNEGTMLGARAGLGADWRRGRWSVSGAIAWSMLDGELEASSGVTPQPGSGLSPTRANFFDDGRSGSIRDLDVAVHWYTASERLRLSLGWEQSSWRDIAADLLRNQPGTTSLRDRDEVTFSGIKLGLELTF